MKSASLRSRTLFLGAAAAFALGAGRPALASSSDDDFAAALGAIHNAAANQGAALKRDSVAADQASGPNDPLLLRQAPLINMIKKVEPSVVYLLMETPPDEDGKKSSAICTGFFTDSAKRLNRPSIITTNAHCVENLAVGAEVSIGLYDGNDNRPKMNKGRVLAYGDSSNAKDIAFVELADASLNRPPLPLWWKLDAGEEVVAIGNPLGFAFSVSKGIISAQGRDSVSGQFLLDANQSDAAVNPGNSGGPLFNMWGSVVGINSMIVTNSGGFEGISLSVPANYIDAALQQYGRTGDLKIGALKIVFGPDKDTQKVTISTVTPGGPADTAGLRAKDQIAGIDGIDLDAMAPEQAQKAFLAHVRYMSPGEKPTIVVRRDGLRLTFVPTLGEMKAPRPQWAPIPKKPTKADPTAYELDSI